MKFKIHVQGVESGRDWWEYYTKNVDDLEEWALKTMNDFNNTLRPGEEPRKYLGFEILDIDEMLHDWIKNSAGMSISFRGAICDLMYCKYCGITGKKFGLSHITVMDSKFKKKAFKKCNTAKEEFQKNPGKYR